MDALVSPVSRYSPLAEQFSHQFPSHDLPSVLAKFSLPVSLSEFRNPLAPPVQEVSHRGWEPRNPDRFRGWEGPCDIGGTYPTRVTKSWLPSQATCRCFTGDRTLRQSQLLPPFLLPWSPPWLQWIVVSVRTPVRGPVRRVPVFPGGTELPGAPFWAWVPQMEDAEVVLFSLSLGLPFFPSVVV